VFIILLFWRLHGLALLPLSCMFFCSYFEGLSVRG